MTLSEFLNHWSITENPFKAEEARDDAVFARMSSAKFPTQGAKGSAARLHAAFHSDFDKILGDLHHPATSIVFGEKGSGKTAIRLQMSRRIAAHNAEHPASKILLVSYDDLGAALARVHDRVGGKTPLESFLTLRLVDHIDGILLSIVPRLVDAILDVRPDPDTLELGDEPRRAIRRLDDFAKRDILLLAAIYDRPEQAEFRIGALRRRLGVWPSLVGVIGAGLAWVGLPILTGALIWGRFFAPEWARQDWAIYSLAGLAVLWVILALKRAAWDRLSRLRTGRKIRKQIRVVGRTHSSYARALGDIPITDPASLPTTDSDEPRYAMLGRLRRVIGFLGYTGAVILVDRVDEPTLVSGDPDRMRAVVWPMLNNKFLQQSGVGVKLLLPVELRHALFKESSAFFQDARLDKQNLIERLSWSGPMLYDLCDARLQACRPEGAPPMALLDLFAEDVSRQDLVDALDQMRQPRDAFKLVYRCLAEHASNVTRDMNAWRVPRLVLDQVRKQEVERLQQLYRGIRPA